MDIDEYLWRHKKSVVDLAAEIGITPNSLIHYKKRRRTPNLFIALRIRQVTNGEVTFVEMLNKEDAEIFEKLVQS